MSSIGKVNASLIGATQETTLTLANLNFDFALFKVDAPAEYQGLGECLSKRRLDAAESGNEHVFARKLGALFSHLLPSTPNLVRVYGKRASEIAREVSKDSATGSAKRGLFNEWLGPDATSIWAAATSGSGAIAAHLLACMLARIWTASEAEAIWDEIIQARKRLLSEVSTSDPSRPAADLAAQIEITRQQISSWDASARAWLEVADRSKLRQQKQLELLVDKLGMSISQSSDTYTSVTEAWITALKTMESVVSGIPHSIRDGAAILALASWHLYPDMFVLGAGPERVAQNDHLLPDGATVTLGQSSYSPDVDGRVCWSLPLAYLKYYGDPVISTRQIGESTSRLSISEFGYVLFGSVVGNWGIYGNNVAQAAEFVVALDDFLVRKSGYINRGRGSWVKMLAEAAQAFLDSSGAERQIIQALIMRGHRRYKNFLSGEKDTWLPLFGIANVNALLQLTKKREDRVKLLRLVAKGIVHAPPDSLIIRYVRPKDRPRMVSDFNDDWSIPRELPGDTFPFAREVPGNEGRWEYATALRGHNSKKRKLEPNSDLSGHVRWSSRDSASFSKNYPGEEHRRLKTIKPTTLGNRVFKWSSVCDHSFISSQSDSLDEQIYECLIGDPADAAIFKRAETIPAGSEMLDIELLLVVLREDWISREKLVNLLDFSGPSQHPRLPEYVHCLRAFAAAADVYKLIPGAGISTQIFSAPLRNALCMPSDPKHQDSNGPMSKLDSEIEAKGSLIHGTTVDPRLLFAKPSSSSSTNLGASESQSESTGITLRQLTTCQLTRPQVFSCIAMFENRSVNLDPRALEQVMAISTGNSIYVAMPLICDPFNSPGASEVKHVVGNIGRPGISLMIPPVVPKVRCVDESQWTMINHNDFMDF